MGCSGSADGLLYATPGGASMARRHTITMTEGAPAAHIDNTPRGTEPDTTRDHQPAGRPGPRCLLSRNPPITKHNTPRSITRFRSLSLRFSAATASTHGIVVRSPETTTARPDATPSFRSLMSPQNTGVRWANHAQAPGSPGLQVCKSPEKKTEEPP